MTTRESRLSGSGWRFEQRERGVPACLSYVVEGKRIRFPGKPRGIRFSLPIADVLETEWAIVVCLKVPAGGNHNENVYALDHEGNFLWRIKPGMFDSKQGLMWD